MGDDRKEIMDFMEKHDLVALAGIAGPIFVKKDQFLDVNGFYSDARTLHELKKYFEPENYESK